MAKTAHVFFMQTLIEKFSIANDFGDNPFQLAHAAAFVSSLDFWQCIGALKHRDIINGAIGAARGRVLDCAAQLFLGVR